MQEAVEPNPFAYPSYNEFFTRTLKSTCRPIDSDTNSIVSPADGSIAQIGNIQDQALIQAKQHQYSLEALLGGDQQLADLFTNGNFATIYLAPKDYHRVHMPFTGKLEKMLYIPGKLFSVNNHATEFIPDLFARNERVVTIFNTVAGPMAVILVGAMIVGSIETAWAGTITPPHYKKINSWEYRADDIILNKGAEMGKFKLGSTVIVLLPAGVAKWQNGLLPDTAVRMGERIGEFSKI